MKVGLDVIEIERIVRTLERHESFRERCFSPAEQAYCDSRPNPPQHYAARFAGKEAVGKALGFGVARAFAWKDVEIAGRPKPAVRLPSAVLRLDRPPPQHRSYPRRRPVARGGMPPGSPGTWAFRWWRPMRSMS